MERMGSRKKWPFHENLSPSSVEPAKEYGFLLSGLVAKFRSVSSSGPMNLVKGCFVVRSVAEARAAEIFNWSMRRARGFDGFAFLGAAAASFAIFSRMSEKFSERS